MKAYILDLDGTLLDSMNVWADVDVAFLKKYGREPEPNLHSDISVMTIAECAAYFRTRYRLPIQEDAIVAEWRQMVGELYRTSVPLKPGAGDFVRGCFARGIPMCVATGTYRPFAEAALRRLGLLECFSFLLTVDEVGKGKGSPEIYERCAERFGLPNADCVVVEDVLYAAQTAVSAGFEVWGICDHASRADWAALQAVCSRCGHSFSDFISK